MLCDPLSMPQAPFPADHNSHTIHSRRPLARTGLPVGISSNALEPAELHRGPKLSPSQSAPPCTPGPPVHHGTQPSPGQRWPGVFQLWDDGSPDYIQGLWPGFNA